MYINICINTFTSINLCKLDAENSERGHASRFSAPHPRREALAFSLHSWSAQCIQQAALQRVAVCCSMMQCDGESKFVAVYCSVNVCPGVLPCVAVRCNALQVMRKHQKCNTPYENLGLVCI